jgi:4-amino-4-deoxy-L-arabinose transferase-like glycosyltransferase
MAAKSTGGREYAFRILELTTRKRFVAGCIAGAVAIRLAWVLLIQPALTSDSRFYFETGASLAAGDGYVAGGEPTAWRPPGYSGFLAMLFRIFWRSSFVAALANVVLYGILLIVWYGLVRELTHSESVARLAILVLAVYPNHIAYSSLVASETLALLLVTLGLYLFVLSKRHRWAGPAAGLVFGLGALVRPTVLLLPLIVGGVELVGAYRRRSRSELRGATASLLAVHVAMVAVLVPWLARTHALFGHYVFANESGVTLLVGNNPYATGGWRMDDRVRGLVPARGDEFEDSTRATDYALDYAREHPVRTLVLLPKKIGFLYAVDHDGAAWNRRGFDQSKTVQRAALGVWAGLSDVFYWVVAIGAGVTLWRRAMPRFGVVVLIFFTAVYLPFFGTSRFHFLAVPWLVLGAVLALPKRLIV